MIQRPLSLITDGRANCRALVNRRIERGFLEVRGLIEALKEDDEGMRSAHEVGPKKCRQAREVRLKRIKQRKRLCRAHAVEIPSKHERVPADCLGYVVHDFESA